MTTKIKLANNVADVDLTTAAPTNGQGLIYNSTSSKWVPGAAGGGGVTTYDTIDDLPLSGVDTGALALVDSTNKLYLWMDTGWYNIATINTNPSITGGNETPYILATDGTPTVITLIASDPEGIPLTWSYEVTSGSLTNGGGTTATVSNVDNVFTVTPTTTEAYAGAFSLTFKASDGVNLGTTVAAFTLAFRIPDSNYTTLLAKGVAATQNATFVDSSTNAHTITRNGDVYQGTFSPYREGGYSMYFDGDGDYLLATPALSTYTNANDPFTIETWVYVAEAATEFTALIAINDNTSYTNVFEAALASDGTQLQLVIDNTNHYFSSITSATWTHLAYVFDGSSIKVYKNGELVYTTAYSLFNYSFSNCVLSIGQEYDSGATPGNYYKGYACNIRMVKSALVYTSNFTPPIAPLEAITNTSLLINTPYIADSSTNAHAITVNGNTSTQPFSPFDHELYAAATNGGSAYFDGTGDYLSANMSAIGTSGFNISLWFMPTDTTGSYRCIFSQGSSGSVLRIFQEATSIQVWVGVAQKINVSGILRSNLWHFIELKRDTSTNNISLFVNAVQIGSSFASTDNFSATSASIGGFDNGSINGYLSDVNIDLAYSSSTTIPVENSISGVNTSLLLNFTNAGIQDYSQVSDLKLLGNATGSNTQTKYASYSMYFDGTGDYIASPAYTLGTGDFTIEAWVYMTAYTGIIAGASIFGTVVGSQSGYSLNAGQDGTSLRLISNASGTWSDTLTTGSGITLNTWTHIALSRNGANLRIFKDGVVIGSTSSAATWNFTGSIGWVGRFYEGINDRYFSGYIEDLRITKGLARYTANFTPTTSELLG